MALTGIEAQVAQDLADRQAKGIKKYGTTVADSPHKDDAYWLQHAYEEALDLAVYLKRLLSENATIDEAKKHLHHGIRRIVNPKDLVHGNVYWVKIQGQEEVLARIVGTKSSDSGLKEVRIDCDGQETDIDLRDDDGNGIKYWDLRKGIVFTEP